MPKLCPIVMNVHKRSSPFLYSLLYLPREPLRGRPCPIQALATPGPSKGTLAAQASLVLEAGSVPGLAYANPGASALNKIAIIRTRALVELTAQRRGRTLTCQSKKI